MLDLKKCDNCKSKKFGYELPVTLISIYLLISGIYVGVKLVKYLITLL